MRTIVITSLIFAAAPAVSFGQSDLQKIGQFLQGIQDMQQQNQGQSNGNQNGTRSAPYNSPNPNASGNQNQGNFQNGNNFFGPGQQQVPTYGNGNPNASGNQNQGNFQNGNHFFGQQNGMQPGQVIRPYNGQPIQNGTYQNGTYSSGQTIYRNGQIVHPQGSTNYGNGQTVYSDPPAAPPRTYSRLPIVIRCSPDAVGICNYELLSGSGSAFPYQIKAGQKQNLSETTDWSIRYRPTPSSPHKTYRLRGGKTYEMRGGSNSWQFYMAP